ncbi:MAG: 3-phosphoshikimate 1-carboxyvinyltransferase [Gammaproteobacteria bacterium]|nr:3-phosphoshikimate 1-carboxyvinyltransferase [Gammaproteobacteria bacterium]
MSLQLPAHAAISGEVRIPGSKSLTNRALLLAALATRDTRLYGALDSEDTALMRAALTQLGVPVEIAGDSLLIGGCGGALGAAGDAQTLYLGLAGTAYRPLTAALSLGKGEYVLEGSARMRERPIAPLVDTLTTLGARIDYLESEGYPPVKVFGGGLEGGVAMLPGTLSSQFLTSLLIAAPLAKKEVRINVPGTQVSKPYIDMTIGMMADFGVEVDRDNYSRYVVRPSRYVSPGEYEIEADASSASYFLAAGAIAGDSLRIVNLPANSVQGDAAFADALRAMGASIDTDERGTRVSRAALTGVDIDLNHMPDAAMTLAVAALFATGATRIRGISTWRIKETDRLEAMRCELSKLGAEVKTTDDSIDIIPPKQLRPARIKTYGDHRMAMCFSLASFGAPVEIEDPKVVEKTFPDYFDVFGRLVRT